MLGVRGLRRLWIFHTDIHADAQSDTGVGFKCDPHAHRLADAHCLSNTNAHRQPDANSDGNAYTTDVMRR